MGFLWGKSRCTEVAGWEDRMTTKLAIAGSTGAVVGGLLAIVQQQPLVRLTAASTASFLMLAGCFTVAQETSRLVRCRDSPANSVLAGAATGALLYKSHGQAGAPGAVIGATLAGAMHLVSAKVDAVGGLQQLLISLDLLDPPPAAQRQQQAEQVAAAGAAADVQPSPPTPRPWWHNYLPVRKVSDAEWEEYRLQQDDEQRKRIDAALAGGLPAVVDRQRQEQPQKPQQPPADEH